MFLTCLVHVIRILWRLSVARGVGLRPRRVDRRCRWRRRWRRVRVPRGRIPSLLWSRGISRRSRGVVVMVTLVRSVVWIWSWLAVGWWSSTPSSSLIVGSREAACVAAPAAAATSSIGRALASVPSSGRGWSSRFGFGFHTFHLLSVEIVILDLHAVVRRFFVFERDKSETAHPSRCHVRLENSLGYTPEFLEIFFELFRRNIVGNATDEYLLAREIVVPRPTV
mmetsp:Transcript_2590/g.4921  ORF Transcript_2590/g.4921 Transcript_2590/m.4921 type:complete len:224 (-) Transcript_2590:553-1224(-)